MKRVQLHQLRLIHTLENNLKMAPMPIACMAYDLQLEGNTSGESSHENPFLLQMRSWWEDKAGEGAAAKRAACHALAGWGVHREFNFCN